MFFDLVKAYNQIPVAEEDIEKNCHNDPVWHVWFENPYLTFGLPNAAQTFQRFMDEVERLGFAYCYINDILIHSTSIEQHQKHLRQLLQRLKENGVLIDYS